MLILSRAVRLQKAAEGDGRPAGHSASSSQGGGHAAVLEDAT